MVKQEMIHFSHVPVLLDACLSYLNLGSGVGTFVDGTVGGGGHSEQIARRLTTGRLICLDRDDAAIAAAGARLAPFGARVILRKSNFSQFGQVLDELGVDRIDGMLLDLGVSSYQLDTPERGFSYMADAPLDMRMSQDSPISAFDVVNGYSEDKLRQILYDYGEERFAGRIASSIIHARAVAPIRTTGELVELIKGAIPVSSRTGGHHPAKRTFQAIRIEVNGELDVIEPTIRQAAERLSPGGRLCIITFHSLEDRIVKETFSSLAQGCICPPRLPVCVCGRKPQGRVVTKKPVLPDEDELERNPRSRSAKLRVFEKAGP
ncbi:MAG: 16S rRNA (cytosine(1402)-N(4))-methyltransferase RsmH [Clostridia bacterium]|nr:16S rRNA (cytosine(1402)-N(4))-methyltransferase RsmH [Clostridia bacterium]